MKHRRVVHTTPSGRCGVASVCARRSSRPAMKSGADMIEIFPCSAIGGAKYLRALRGRLPGLELLPTGGVTVHTVHEYIEAGAAALGVGSELVDAKRLSTEGGEHALAARAREFLDALHKARHL